MEISLRLQDTESTPLSMNNSSPRISNNNSIGIQIPTTPKTITRSDSNTTPYPTTFVQADTSTFKQVVQMLTGSSETSQQQQQQDPVPSSSSSSKNFNIPPMKTTPKKQQGFKLYERRNNNNNNLKNTLMINTLVPNFVSHNKAHENILSPSLLDFPSLTLSSPVTPLNDDPFDKSSLGSTSSEEEKAIAEKGFYFHPSPMSTPRDFQPQLLPLFPVTSPRISESPS